MKSFRPTRRTFLKTGTAAAALIGIAPAVLRQAAAQEADLAPYKAAKIDWQQASGETITVAVIPASYFENLITLAPQFKALTGIDVRFEKIPPAQIRQKVRHRPHLEDRHLRDACRRPDVLFALCREQMGRAARQLSRATNR